MIQDARGKEIAVGDVVVVKFVVRDLVADSQGLNLLASHSGGHRGLPDDWRLPLESSQCEIVQHAAKQATPQDLQAAKAAEEQAEQGSETAAEPEARQGKAAKASHPEPKHSRA